MEQLLNSFVRNVCHVTNTLSQNCNTAVETIPIFTKQSGTLAIIARDVLGSFVPSFRFFANLIYQLIVYSEVHQAVHNETNNSRNSSS